MRVASKIYLILTLVGCACACSPTKYVGKDEYLLDKVKVSVEEKAFNAADLKRDLRQRPNTPVKNWGRIQYCSYWTKCQKCRNYRP